MLTPAQSKEWFEKNPQCYRFICAGMYEAVSTEELYQAFRTRLWQEIKAESVTNNFPDVKV